MWMYSAPHDLDQWMWRISFFLLDVKSSRSNELSWIICVDEKWTLATIWRDLIHVDYRGSLACDGNKSDVPTL